MELADQVGLDVFGVGEHHRPDFAVSSPAVVLAAGAERTSRIRLTSAVSVLSSDDPVRVFQDFATLDLLSGGRAEIMAGRGSFIESFPLFGYDLARLRRAVRGEAPAAARAARLRARHVVGAASRADRRSRRLPAAAAGSAADLGRRRRRARVGGARRARSGCRWRSRSSAGCRSGSRRSPRSTARRRGAPGTTWRRVPLSINSHGFIAETSQAAADAAFPPFLHQMTKIGRERGWPPVQRQDFDAGRTLRGALFVGSPAEVTEKILFQHEIFGHERFLLQLSVGTMPHRDLLRAIELFGTEVAPAVRAALAPETAGISG